MQWFYFAFRHLCTSLRKSQLFRKWRSYSNLWNIVEKIGKNIEKHNFVAGHSGSRWPWHYYKCQNLDMLVILEQFLPCLLGTNMLFFHMKKCTGLFLLFFFTVFCQDNPVNKSCFSHLTFFSEDLGDQRKDKFSSSFVQERTWNSHTTRDLFWYLPPAWLTMGITKTLCNKEENLIEPIFLHCWCNHSQKTHSVSKLYFCPP